MSEQLLAFLASARAAKPVRIGWRTREQPAWTFDLDALAATHRALGLERPVVVGCAEYARSNTDGRQSNLRDRDTREWTHKIRVRRAAGPREASRILWHELAHCAQAERLGVEAFDRAYRAEQRTVGYRRNRFEVEARRWEAHADTRPLVRPIDLRSAAR